MKKYLQPELELIELNTQDVLTVSDGENMDVGGDWNDSWDRREL